VRILWIGTKSPWPSRDGGRLVSANTLVALADAGHALTVVTPVTPDDDAGPEVGDAHRLRSVPVRDVLPTRAASLWAGLWRGIPASIARHANEGVRQAVARLVEEEPFDCVHVEQLQALASAAPAAARGLPVVLRAQNVESDLWAGTAAAAGVLRLPVQIEARRMARFEAAALHRVDAVVALTRSDAKRLQSISGREVDVVPAPFPAQLPNAEVALEGTPPVILLGDGSWRPNAGAARFFLDAVWPKLSSRLPGAWLHVFGQRFPASRNRVVCVPRLAESRAAFPVGAILAVPLFVASGVRMKILEAWARRVPVVASPAAVAGLDATDGRHLLVAPTAEAFVDAIAALHSDPDRGARLTAAGASLLAQRHDPTAVAEALGRVYEREVGRKKKSSQCSWRSDSNGTRAPERSSTKQS